MPEFVVAAAVVMMKKFTVKAENERALAEMIHERITNRDSGELDLGRFQQGEMTVHVAELLPAATVEQPRVLTA